MENNEKKDDYLLEVNDLKMYFDITTGFFKTTPLKAVDGVSFKIKRGETLGVVGESGCGKTTLGRTIMNLYNPSSGDILFDGVSISPYSDLKKIRVEKKFTARCYRYEAGKEIKAIHQEKSERIADLREAADSEIAEIEKKYDSESDGKDRMTGEIEKVEAEFRAKASECTSKAQMDAEKTMIELNEKITESNRAYDKKYEAKKAEIEKSLADIAKEKADKLASLAEPQHDTELETRTNSEIAEMKKVASQKIAEARGVYQKEYEEAVHKRASQLSAWKQEYAERLAEINKEQDSSKRKKALKSYGNDRIVSREKIINDFSVAKSVAYGKYQDFMIKTEEELKKAISEKRAEVPYFLYEDTLHAIETEAHDKSYAIRSSSKIRMKKFRKECTMVFQDPYSSLNPRMTVADIIAEPLDVNHLYRTKEERRSMILELMRKVGLSPEQSTRYAHEFSGGQRQRIGIARALAVNPKFVVCDEPVSALDVSIQAQVINTFEDLQNDLGLTYLFIAHDLLVIRHISDRIAVMYLGRVVELAETDEIFNHPLHPYTISLLSAIPVPDPNQARANKRIILEGDVPSPLNVPSGCSFRTRCSRACEQCKHEIPRLTEVEPGHFVSCLLVQDEKNQK